jgi:hypothetical protein
MPRYKRYGYTISVINTYPGESWVSAIADPAVVAFELNEKKAQELMSALLSQPEKDATVVADTSYDYVEQTSGDILRAVLIEYQRSRIRSRIILQRWFVWVGKE